MKRVHDADPAWSRGGSNTKKKRKMCSRASLRLLSTLAKQKRAADLTRKRDKTICATRTVELPSTQVVGDHKNKLLFMLAIGLVPNSKKESKVHPMVCVERLDSAVEAEARARTREIIYEIFQRRKQESLQRRLVYRDPTVPVTPSLPYKSHPPSSIDDDVEIVDLVSSDEETCGSSEEEMQMSARGNSSYHSNLFRRQGPMVNSTYCGSEKFKIITSSPIPRKPVFKPLGNNQDSGRIFRNWKPESMTRLMNLNNGNSEKDERKKTMNQAQSKLLSSLKSIPVAASFGARKFPSAGTSCKSHVHGVREDTTSSTSVEFIVPDTLITID